VPTEELHFSGFLREDTPALDSIANPRFRKFVSALAPECLTTQQGYLGKPGQSGGKPCHTSFVPRQSPTSPRANSPRNIKTTTGKNSSKSDYSVW